MFCTSSALILHKSLMVPNFLSLENPLSDSYFVHSLLTMYMYYSKLLVYDIANVSM